MNHLCAFLSSTVGKKLLVGLSGLAMAGFLLSHMAGNLLLFLGPEAYNWYSYKLTSNPLIYVAEAGLVLVLVVHVTLTVQLTARNRAARGGTGYDKAAGGKKRTSFAAKTLILSGLLIFAFIGLHLWAFKFGPHYTVTYGDTEMRDLYQLVVERFQSPAYVGWYVFAMLILCAHLSHGVSASLQSLGLFAANNKGLRRVSWAFAILVTAGFAAQPLYMFLGNAQ